MIKVGKTLKELDSLAEIHFDILNADLDLETKLNNMVANSTGPKLAFYIALQNDLKDIIISKPAKLENFITSIGPLYSAYQTAYHAANPLNTRKKNNSLLKQEVFTVFNYSLFTIFDHGRLAYDLSFKINSNVCLYCNTQYTFTIKKKVKNKEAKTRPQFDHFFLKSKYPYLALSFYNLIPSCYVCNANLKTTKDFKPSTHVHPYLEDINDSHLFQTNVNAPDYLLGHSGFDLKLVPLKNAKPDKQKRSEKNIEDFIINDQYQFHKNYAGEIIKKAYIYNESKLDELLSDFEINGHKLFSSKQEILDMVFGDYIHDDKLHTRILSKLTRDILTELKISI